jgi:hypothetical protein
LNVEIKRKKLKKKNQKKKNPRHVDLTGLAHQAFQKSTNTKVWAILFIYIDIGSIACHHPLFKKKI